MVLVCNDPAPSFPAQADRQAKPGLGIRCQLICSRAAKQGGCIGDILAGSDIQPNDLECTAGLQPVEERRPRLTVAVDAADLDRRRYIEHQDVIRMVRNGSLDIQIAYRSSPALDQVAYFRL